jgi:hypothetical protein
MEQYPASDTQGYRRTENQDDLLGECVLVELLP